MKDGSESLISPSHQSKRKQNQKVQAAYLKCNLTMSHIALDIEQTTNEPALLKLDYAQVCIDDILWLANKPFKDKLEQLQAVFQRISLNANAVLLAQAAWKYSGYWISQGHNQLATHNTCGIRQMSEHELWCFSRMSTHLQTMGM
jgi:hypothetical protein